MNNYNYRNEASQLSSASVSMANDMRKLEASSKDLSAELNIWQKNAFAMEHSIAKSADITQPLWLRTLHNVRKESAMIMWRYGLALGFYKTKQEKPDFDGMTLGHCREYNVMALASFIVAYNNNVTTKVVTLLLNQLGVDSSRYVNGFETPEQAGERLRSALVLHKTMDDHIKSIGYQIDGSMTLFDAALKLSREIRSNLGAELFNGDSGLRFQSEQLARLLQRYIPTYLKSSELYDYIGANNSNLKWAFFDYNDRSHVGFSLKDSDYNQSNFLFGMIDGLMIAGVYPNIIHDLPMTGELDLNGTSTLEKEKMIENDYLTVKGWLK